MDSIRPEKYVWDNSALVDMVNSDTPRHDSCYGFMKNYEQAVHIFPAIVWAEFQATQSRRARNGLNSYRELRLLDHKNIIYPIDHEFIKKMHAHDLYIKFEKLRGMDLIYAGIAFLEEASLVTLDKKDFSQVQGITIIYPNEL